MAEGMLSAWGGGRFEVRSAGTVATQVRPEAVEVMRELGVDITGHESKAMDGFLGESFDLVVTVCDEAREACPYFPGAGRMLHWSFEDPSAASGSPDDRLAVFRRVRDEIGGRIRSELLAVGGGEAGDEPR
jgi:arsenate reductase